jgi:hypothetical protein
MSNIRIPPSPPIQNMSARRAPFLLAERSKARGALREGFESRSGPRASRRGSEAGSCGKACDGKL